MLKVHTHRAVVIYLYGNLLKLNSNANNCLLILIDAQLELFGSSANGFSSYQSDLDLCLTLPQIPVEKVLYSAGLLLFIRCLLL